MTDRDLLRHSLAVLAVLAAGPVGADLAQPVKPF